jgi:hypothetical protein
LEQTNAGVCGHVAAKGKRGQTDAECVMFRAVCGDSDGARDDAGALAVLEDGNRGGERQGREPDRPSCFRKVHLHCNLGLLASMPFVSPLPIVTPREAADSSSRFCGSPVFCKIR